MQPYIKETTIGALVSDHNKVITTIDLNSYPSVNKPWELRKGLLKDPDYVKLIKRTIAEQQLRLSNPQSVE